MVAIGNLPAEPGFELGGGGNVERETEIASVAHVGKERKCFRQRGASVENFGVQTLARVNFRRFTRERRNGSRAAEVGRIIFLVKVATTKNIELRVLRFDQ